MEVVQNKAVSNRIAHWISPVVLPEDSGSTGELPSDGVVLWSWADGGGSSAAWSIVCAGADALSVEHATHSSAAWIHLASEGLHVRATVLSFDQSVLEMTGTGSVPNQKVLSYPEKSFVFDWSPESVSVGIGADVVESVPYVVVLLSDGRTYRVHGLYD